MGIPFFAGIGLSLAAIVVSTIMDGNSFGPLIGPSSILLVLGCAIGASMMAAEMGELTGFPKAIIRSLKAGDVDYDERIGRYMHLAEVARREGLLALDAKIDDMEDEFVQFGLRMVTDGRDENDVRSELAAWAEAVDQRHAIAPAMARRLASYAPAFGMVGTVIGLINMLGNISSPENLGSGMALALLTTLYGSLLANLVFQPLAERMEKLHEAEMSVLAFDTDAILAVQRGTNPRNLVGHLESLLPPASRVGYDERANRSAA